LEKEVALASFETSYRYFPGDAEENHEMLQSISVPQRRFEAGTSLSLDA
jgi:hypothetical protein